MLFKFLTSKFEQESEIQKGGTNELNVGNAMLRNQSTKHETG